MCQFFKYTRVFFTVETKNIQYILLKFGISNLPQNDFFLNYFKILFNDKTPLDILLYKIAKSRIH